MAAAARKQKSVAYLLWCLGFCGLCGVHRLYTERYLLGLLYLFTFGFCFFGQLIDLLLIPDDVGAFNHALRQRSSGTELLPPRSGSLPVTGSARVTEQPPSPQAPGSARPEGEPAVSSGRPVEDAPLSRRTQALFADAQASMQRLDDPF